MAVQDTEFGLYVHWPFCQSKCPYCDFNSHVQASVDQSAWRSAFRKEIARVGELVGPRVLNTIYFGGGTPSLMEGETVGAIINAAREQWAFANDIEITLEANPGSVEVSRFEEYQRVGVNRVSIGVQAMVQDDLKRLGRLHSTEEALAALDIAKQIFDRVSFDLIYSRQDQSLNAWRDELSRALEIGSGHMSLYQLTIEDGTAFGDRFARGMLRGLPNEDLSTDMYFLTQEMMSQAGLPAYEISNHALPGQESRHNLLYWSGGDYAGIGPGAHGRLTIGGQRFASVSKSMPRHWLDAAEHGNADQQFDLLSAKDIVTERLLMGLRIDKGVDLAVLPSGKTEILYNIKYLEPNHFLLDGTRLSITNEGRPLLNAILSRLLT